MNNLNDYMGYLFSQGREEEILGTSKRCPICKRKLEVISNSNTNMFYICNNCNITLNKELTEYEEIDKSKRYKRKY